jgi:hypothetical protein
LPTGNNSHGEVLSTALFVVTMLVIAAVRLSARAMEHYERAPGINWKEVVHFGEGLLPPLLGARQVRVDNMAKRELPLQFRNQRNHFVRARQQLGRLAAQSAWTTCCWSPAGTRSWRVSCR